MAGRPMEVATNFTKVTFLLSLLKEEAANWAMQFIEENKLMLDNDQNFTCKFKGHFWEPIQKITVSLEIGKLAM